MNRFPKEITVNSCLREEVISQGLPGEGQSLAVPTPVSVEQNEHQANLLCLVLKVQILLVRI